MLDRVTKQHKAVAVDSAIGEFQLRRLDSPGKEWNACAEKYWIDFHDDLVNLGK